MATQLTFEHDVLGDILYIESCRPYPAQDEDDIEDCVIARCNPDTDVVESVMIMSFRHRIISRDPLRLEIPVAPGSICGQPAAPEFDCLVQPGSPWLTFPPDAEITELYIPGWTETPAETPAPTPA